MPEPDVAWHDLILEKCYAEASLLSKRILALQAGRKRAVERVKNGGEICSPQPVQLVLM